MEYTRKIDQMGRIMLPKSLRKQFGLRIGQHLSFTPKEENGHNYLIIDCGETNTKIKEAMALLEEYGIDL